MTAKLTAGYEINLENIDIQIGELTKRIQKFRSLKTKEAEQRMDDFRQEKAIANAKRQLMVQFIKDLEDVDEVSANRIAHECYSELNQLTKKVVDLLEKYVINPVNVTGEEQANASELIDAFNSHWQDGENSP